MDAHFAGLAGARSPHFLLGLILLSVAVVLGHPFKNWHFETENDPLPPACQHSRVGVQSGVVNRIPMRYDDTLT